MEYLIKRYFSGFCTNQVQAENDDEALEIARRLPIDYDEICQTLENWEDCDEVEMDEVQLNDSK